MRSRDGEQADVFLPEAKRTVDVKARMDDSQVGQHRAFWNARGARRVEDRYIVLFRDNHWRRHGGGVPLQVSVGPRTFDVAANREALCERVIVAKGRHAVGELGFVNQRLDACVRHNEAIFVKPLADVDRHDDGAKPGASENDFREFDPVAENQSDPVSSRDAGARQVRRDPRYVGLEIRVGHTSMIVDEHRFSREGERRRLEQRIRRIRAGPMAGDPPPVVVRFLPDLVHYREPF